MSVHADNPPISASGVRRVNRVKQPNHWDVVHLKDLFTVKSKLSIGLQLSENLVKTTPCHNRNCEQAISQLKPIIERHSFLENAQKILLAQIEAPQL